MSHVVFFSAWWCEWYRCMQTGLAVQAEDPHLWLEDVLADPCLDWAKVCYTYATDLLACWHTYACETK